MEKVLVKYHEEGLEPIKWTENGDFLDLRSAKDVTLKKGEFTLIDLGVSIKLPEGYWGQVVPRSSTYKNFGIIQTNSFCVIDVSYCGENDVWLMPVLAMRDTVIHKNDRICQFTIHKKIEKFDIEQVDSMEGPSRGGIGSTGVK